MQKFDKMIVLAVLLTFLAGVIIGQGFSFEVKLSDLIATAAALITFLFAWNGLKHNEKQFLNSIQPVVEKLEHTDRSKGTYRFTLHNYGNGAAISFEYKLFWADSEINQTELEGKINTDFGNITVELGGPLGLSPNSSDDLMFIEGIFNDDFEKFLRLLKKLEVELKFSTTQGQVITKQLRFGHI
ncbi:hypothetical protein [Pseudoalteromonas lipolytica]|uniref:hypothetical protein n=1 Tax=Pseudoalteromonas lipolytica TaxID=570156 RepID=UPI000C41CC46|nr:hypothetical protein [Pseudoalteromonas lipolytica]MAE02321.1 hypothetical protein [Pseudoalteromonas sp.]|tara:strand:+ start:2926 stop:3480 length:555 start_codon:yes stop_codon:yes gene_type:complete